MTDLKSLSNASNKISLLRELCLATGIKLNCKEFILDNDLSEVTTKMQRLASQSDYYVQPSQQKGNKKRSPQTLVPDLSNIENIKYEHLPFQISDVQELFPIIKQLDVNNQDCKNMMQDAKSFFKDQILERAFDLFTRAINVML